MTQSSESVNVGGIRRRVYHQQRIAAAAIKDSGMVMRRLHAEVTNMTLSPMDQTLSRIAAAYLAFAEREAHGRSVLYEELARGVAADETVLSFLGQLPRPKQQPNLLFAAVKYLCGVPSDWNHFRRLLDERRDSITRIMMSRSTQTNEPARCATLLPVLALLPRPLALLEVGAAAGLCLIPDRYAYDYGDVRLPPVSLAAAPVFHCHANRAPLPGSGLEIIWRAGLDLNPVDIANPSEVAWLEALVWPDEGNRLELLRSTLAVARHDPPRIVQGDLRTDLRALVAEMPADVTRVIFHTAVLGYVGSADEQLAFAEMMTELDVTWISNEPPAVFPDLAQGLSKPWPLGQFLLTMNRRPIAWTDPHGTSLDWIAGR